MTGIVTYTTAEIASVIGVRFITGKEDLQIQHLLIDSRKLLFPSTSLFFALNSPRRSGSSFIAELYDKGVRAFVTDDRLLDPTAFPEATIISVDDTLAALQKLAAHHRAKFKMPVIGITGSNGKTIVKEWLFQLLQGDYNIVRSPKSYNSQIGVPLSVWEINAAHNLGIFEAGISFPGEMEKLQPIIQPSIGVFTSLGDAHNEGFINLNQKAEEKLKLFYNSQVLVYCRDFQELEHAVAANNAGMIQRGFTWSRNIDADLRVLDIRHQSGATLLYLNYKGTPLNIKCPFNDEASIENIITCICVLLILKIDVDQIQRRVLQLIPVEMRLQLRQGVNNCSIIDDSYSADLSSLQIALDFLQQQKQHLKHTVVISDILQSGKTETQLYSELGDLLRRKNVDRLIGVGPVIKQNRQLFNNIPFTRFFSSSAELKRNIASLQFQNEAILLKGAGNHQHNQFLQ